MRRIKGAVFLSLDGVMQAPGGPSEDPTGGFAHGGWVAGVFDEGIGRTLGALFTPPYALLLGRRTYDIFAAHWPHATRDDAAMGEAFTAADKYVLSHRDIATSWANTHRLGGIADVAAPKGTEGPDLVIQGSSTLYPALLAAGLLDEVTTMTFPIVLGTGKRLFGDGTPAGALKVTDSYVTDAGTVVATYEPAGPLTIGNFAIAEQSAEEQARQRRMAEGSW